MNLNDILESYSKAITAEMLGLHVGDALSINTEERDLELAKMIAKDAVSLTDVTVKIVITENGRPSDVIEFDPQPPAHDPKSFAMLRLSHVAKHVQSEGPVLDMIIDANDLGTLQRYGHLAEPIQLNRRIAVPWCVATVYDYDDMESWEKLGSKIRLGISNQGLAARYRISELNASSICRMDYSDGKNGIEFTIPEGIEMVSGCQTLGSGRDFLSGPDFDRLSVLVDREKVNGEFQGIASVFGKDIRTHLVFKDGLLVDWTHSKDLERILSFDENLRRVGYITLSDKCFELSLGGALTEGLVVLPEDEENLPDFFNTSLYSVKIRHEGPYKASFTTETGLEKQLVADGFFTE